MVEPLQEEPLKFENTAANYFQLDPNPSNNVPRQVRGFAYSKCTPTPVKNPYIASLSESALNIIGLKKATLLDNKQLYADYLSGNRLFPGSLPLSHNYCGHQFGTFAGQLGDGRAITLGDVKTGDGGLMELQLKGAGKTPYSRQADGRAVLRSSVREYLCSEAMHYLGIPTSRAASLVVSDETKVQRDPLYSGNVIWEKCAIVMRLAPTFFRFGSFEVFKERDPMSGRSGPSVGLQDDMLQHMLDFVLDHFYSDLPIPDPSLTIYQSFFQELTLRTVKMVAHWQCVGYVHGVMNTDNMSILGLTIDYGPFGFMEYFNPRLVSNHSDQEARYCYENQPKTCKYNLKRLAEALDPVVPLAWSMEYIDKKYDEMYSAEYLDMMARKLGFKIQGQVKSELSDAEFELISSLMGHVMPETATDFTNTFRILSKVTKEGPLDEVLDKLVSYSAPIEHKKAMNKPHYATGALLKIKDILENNPHVLAMFGLDPDMARKELELYEKYKAFDTQSEEAHNSKNRETWAKWLYQYQKVLNPSITDQARAESMNKINPKFILRNYLLEQAIRAADDQGDYQVVEDLLQMASDPYSEERISEVSVQPAPKWAYELCVSCSS
ncbi:hypothetical protein FGO68_gene17630 [Halteria grandinella]|uniref:Selenoprotein O n=1 Tax=Halteria grandinella TaxID=5974 RepID=A0A8J8T3Z9_HALGN|nr:hypothetical protein FGO68_gene17630 [Halteria grandinella]